MAYTVEDLEAWEERNGEDVVFDGPFCLTEDDDSSFTKKLVEEFKLDDTNIGDSYDAMETVIDNCYSNGESQDEFRYKVLVIYLGIINEGDYKMIF